jgi:uncharacterized protein (DUF302 family)
MASRQPTSAIEYVSVDGFDATLRRLVEAIEGAGMKILAKIDHAAGARAVGLEMPPNTVLLYGNPKAGTPIMLEAPGAALDLPLRLLLREGGDGKAILSFHPIAAVMQDAGVSAQMAARLGPAQQVILQAIKP